MSNNKNLSLIDALCIVKTGWRTEQEKELLDNAYLVIKKHSEILHLEYQKQCIEEKLTENKEVTMSNNKQTSVDIIYQGMSDKIVMQDLNKALICIHISHDDFLKLHKQAKAMHHKEVVDFVEDWYCNGPLLGGGVDVIATIEEHYNETFGGNK